MSDWQPTQGGVPIYRQIFLHFQELITNGTLPPGSKLPTERSLADQLGVNRSTVAAAFDELRSTGLVESRQGRGTTVSETRWGVHQRPKLNWSFFINDAFTPTLPLMKQVRAAASSPHVIDLASGGLGAHLQPTSVLESLLGQLQLGGTLDYPEATGLLELRQALSTLFKQEYGVEVHTNEQLITSGAQQAFLLIVQCLLNAGDVVAVECPSYTYTLNCFALSGIKMVQLPVDGEGLIPDEIVSLYQRFGIRAIFTNPTYQNPTGTTLSLERRLQLLKLSRQLRIPVIEIDFFNALTHPSEMKSPPSLYALDEGEGHVIQVGSLSDSVAPGLRIGWILGRRQVIERLADAKHQIDLGTSVLPQKLAAKYIQGGNWTRHVQLLRKELEAHKRCLVSALKRHGLTQLEMVLPEGGGDLWCKVPSEFDERALLQQAIRQNVVFSPGTIYGAERGFMRLSFSTIPPHLLEEGARRLGEAWHVTV